jgi:S-methylmethionine-dependent homocysteine/selenocysteine methylase
MIKEWIDLGARWIGGCCQIFPPDIAEMVKVIKSYRKENDKIQQNKITVI